VCSKGHDEGLTKDGKCKRCAYNRNRAYVKRQSIEWHTKRTARHRELMITRWRSTHLGRKYGLTGSQVDAMRNSQGGKCAICGRHESELPQGKVTGRLHIDHCHNTNEVRGLLCYSCNYGLGHFRDSPEIMALAIAYLKNQEGLHQAGKRQQIPFSSPVRA
jgi:hypothetical protein